MGCHTWLYEKIDPQPTYEDVKNWVINDIKETLEIWKSPKFQNSNRYDLSQEEISREIELSSRELRMIEKGYLKSGIYLKYRHNNSLTKFYKGQLYQRIEYTPFLFRVFSYQTNILTTYQEAEKFILETLETLECSMRASCPFKKQNVILLASEDGDENSLDPRLSLERTREFFKIHPNGMIRFG